MLVREGRPLSVSLEPMNVPQEKSKCYLFTLLIFLMDVTKTKCVTISSAWLSFQYDHEKQTGLQKLRSILVKHIFILDYLLFSCPWHENKTHCHHWG